MSNGRCGRLAILSLLAAAATLRAQDATPIFQTTTELVLVDVQVLHTRTRAPAPRLQGKDLRVFEDGAEQEIRQFSRDELPLSVVLLFDLTPSVHGVLKRLAEGAAAALVHFKPQDEIAVMVYGTGARLVDGFSTGRERTARAIAQAAAMKVNEEAYFNEAVYQAAMQLRQSSAPVTRRVIVWLTDNEPNVPYHTEHPVHTEMEAIRALHEEGVVVAPILMKDPKWLPIIAMMSVIEGPWAKSHPPGDAHKYAELTGGQATSLRGKNADERLGELIDELRARYTVGYRPAEPKPAGTFCKLRVELAPEGALRTKEWTVLARQGYYRK
jgi:VWFA-related protein